MSAGEALRQVAPALGLARSTLGGWREALPLEDARDELASALPTPDGVQWLSRLVVALHLMMTLRAAGGVRLVGVWVSGTHGLVGPRRRLLRQLAGGECSAAGGVGGGGAGAARSPWCADARARGGGVSR